MVIWLIGMSRAGKTTIGKLVYEKWKCRKPNTVFIDGDEIRALFAQDRNEGDYSIAGRRKNAERIFALCRFLDSQEINVVCCILSIFPELRIINRETFSSYFEVFIRVPVNILTARDDKGIYAPAIRGVNSNVVGVDIDFPEPQEADLIIDNSSFNVAPSDHAHQILTVAEAW